MNNKIAFYLGIAASALVLALILFIIPWLTGASAIPTYPNPNGYDELAKAREMRRNDYAKYKDLNQEELEDLLKDDQDTLRQLRIGLTNQSRVPISYSEAALEPHFRELGGFKALAHLLAAAGRSAELSERSGEAAQYGVDLVQMGHEIRRGGLIIDLLVGVACEAIGLNELDGLLAQLDASQCRDLVQKLTIIDEKREPDKTLFHAERLWVKRTFRWRWVILRVLKPGMIKEAEPKALRKVHEVDAQRRRLMVEAAMRAYELDKGSRPRALSDLVPAYLKAIPVDPETGGPLVSHL